MKNLFSKKTQKEFTTYTVTYEEVRYAQENKFYHEDKVWKVMKSTEVECFTEYEVESVIEGWTKNLQRIGAEGMYGTGMFVIDNERAMSITVKKYVG